MQLLVRELGRRRPNGHIANRGKQTGAAIISSSEPGGALCFDLEWAMPVPELGVYYLDFGSGTWPFGETNNESNPTS